MLVNKVNLLTWLLLMVALVWSWQFNGGVAMSQAEPRHKTCDNEQRYENQVMCEGKEFGALVPYPDNCSLFLVCDCLYPTVKLCPAELWWDNASQICNYPQSVDCVYYTIETPEPTDGTTRITPVITTESTTLSTPKVTEHPTTLSTPKVTEHPTTLSTPKVTEYPTTPKVTDVPCITPTSSWDPPSAPPGISDDFCRHQSDGSVHPYPYDCQAYINCTHGWPVLKYCIEDKVFNPWLFICDTPETTECEEEPLPTATPTTTELAPTSTTEADDVECGPTPEFVEEDYCQPLGNGFYEYPYNCSAYLLCRNGCTDLDYCISDKLFNPWLHICDTPDSVYCDPLPYPTAPPSSTTPSSTTTSVDVSTTESTTATTEAATSTTPGLPPDVNPNECRGVPDGTRLPYAGNCSQFLICKDDQVEMGQCPPLTLFNPDLLICDEADDVLCYGDRTTTPIPTTTTTEATTPTPTTTTTKATTLGPEELCEGQSLGASFAYPQDCSKYYLCLGGGQWFLTDCIYGSYFDPNTMNCGPNVSPTACQEGQATTTTAATTTTQKVTTPTTTTEEPSTPAATTTTQAPPGGICGGRDEGENIAYPKDCNKYIVCVSPIPIAFYCPAGSYFSSKLQNCASWEESDCDQDASTTTLSPGITQAPLEPTMCTNSSRDTFPYPDNCQWFIRCVDDYIYMMDVCNCGEYYDPISGKCGTDVPSDACRWDYTSTTSTTSEPTTSTAVTRPPPQKGPCDDVADGALVPYPNDCTKYIKCDRPIATAFDCEEGDEFSVALGECVDASLAGCSVTTTTNPSGSTTPSIPSTKTTEGDSSTDSSTASSTESSTESSTVSSTESTTESSTDSSTESSTDSSTFSSTDSSTESSTAAITTTEPDSSSTEPGTTTSDSPTTTTPKPSGGVCEGKTDDSLVPYPNNCSKFIMCQYPIPVGFDCPEGLEFSPTELQCMDPDLANCSPSVTTPAIPTTTTSEASTTESTTDSTTKEPSITDSTTKEPSTTDSTTKSTTTEPTTESTTTEPSTTVSTTESSTTVSTTESTTKEPSTTESTTESTTQSTTDSTTESSTTDSTTKEPSTTESTTTESTTVSTTESTTKEPSTTQSTTESTTDSTTESSTTDSTTKEPSTTESTTTESTTVSTTESTTKEPSTTESTTESTTDSTTESSTTESTTTEPSTTDSTTKSTTAEPSTTTEPSTTDSTTKSTTTEPSTTVSTTEEPSTTVSTTESTTESTTKEPSTTESSTPEPSTTPKEPTTLDPYTPNICCGYPLGTLLPYPNDCMRYVVCDYPIPYAVDCDPGTFFDDRLLQCTSIPTQSCIYKRA
ncbi:mucin-5AC isoform X1 [Drosophila pseudoobscura]|uniref:Mucin-5AC isoform X1 n=1 Tax=Drosophila pseudoobscura pseudoobscura TaxID=46245 RepID=A0A6I8W9P0_DROPS|nr:mucin-5AC isoform X1 [Drosophila pseudoobscura]